MTQQPDHDQTHYEVIVIGAGVCGIYQIKRLTDLGVSATVLEMGGDLGGTWFFNRYPGARFDSESYTYGYSFSKELLDEWDWKERYSPQPENLKYLNFVADKFDLRKHMQFNVKVDRAEWGEDAQLWTLSLSDGRTLTCRFMVMGLGLLSQPTEPAVPGREKFAGPAFHTYYWPRDGINLQGKRVGIIGTGATAIQIIPEIAKQAKELKVFQRRPNWASPLNNYEISGQEMNEIRLRYDEIFKACAKSPGGFEHHPDRRGFWEVTREERLELWDRLYDEPGFGIWLKNFREIFTDEKANAEFSEYIEGRIKERVRDPWTADKLIPKDHGYGVQRVPLETYYYEAFNKKNVQLVCLQDTPLQEITETGIQTNAEHYDLDVIIYSTGFDAMTGAFDHIDIRGTGGQTLKGKWEHAVSTYLGMTIHGFPNMLIPAGPQSGSASTNYPRGIETGVNWVTGFLEHIWEKGYTRVEANADAEEQWTDHVRGMYSSMLMRKAKSWFTGYNSNVKGHEAGNPRYLVYNGGSPKYVNIINDVVSENYRGIDLSGGPEAAQSASAAE
jgi:cation diffusion facilitator CzcD-associated flavoprotein CzcO